jgi:hypothetical protein
VWQAVDVWVEGCETLRPLLWVSTDRIILRTISGVVYEHGSGTQGWEVLQSGVYL